MANWPPVPEEFRSPLDALQPPLPPPPGSAYTCYGERFPRNALPPPARSADFDASEALQAMHAGLASSYLELLDSMSAAPSVDHAHDLALRAQGFDEQVTEMQRILADDCRQWEAGEELVQAMRAQIGRKTECARALNAASESAERQLNALLESPRDTSQTGAAAVQGALTAEQFAHIQSALDAVRDALRDAVQA